MHAVEIYMTESLEERVRDNYHTVLIAKNMDGVRELNSLVSRSCNEDHFYYTNRISFDEFLNLSDNIISTSACLASPLNKLPEDHPMYMKLAEKYTFLEVQPHHIQDQVEYNKRLLGLSKRLGKPLIAGTDTHNSSTYKAECRSALLSAKHKSYGDEDTLDLTFKTYDELVEMFRTQQALTEDEYMQAIENTNLLYDMTEELELDTSIKYPILYGSREADSAKFEEIIRVKFEDKIRNGVIPENQIENFKKAIQEELRVFKKLKMDGFMLSMSELVSWCKENGMAIGNARGSVGGSRIAYITDIIDLNPETWHTVFSRFCNEDREEVGDVDLDCVESDRPKIFAHIINKFGRDKTARVASFGTLQEKGVIDDVGRHLAKVWNESNTFGENPWSLKNIAKIKDEYDSNKEKTKKKYKELFYYMDGLLGTKISQSIHPAGMVISPISLDDNFGVFDKDGDSCLMLDMENIHDYTGLVKYDFLVLKTVQVIRDCCKYLGEEYPKSHQINWEDQNVWDNMLKGPEAIFQMESSFAFDSLRKFKPRNLFDMSLVTACIRPSGSSYRDDLLSHKHHSNPSEIIDNLLKDNNGFLVYQEDIIKFLQQVCGLSGSQADNVRRAIGRKQKDRLDAALPVILDGYCKNSEKPKEESEKEAMEFLQIIEDASAYMFGYNHSIAYCMLGYLCAYYRYYHPLEFITSFLNNAANDDDINNGTNYAERIGIRVTMPKWGVSRSDYSFDKEKNVIAKGLSSVKYMNASVPEELFRISHEREYKRFVDVLDAINKESSIDTRQIDILIKIDFFSDFGNQRELLYIMDMFYNQFKKGDAKQISKDKISNTPIEFIVKKYSVGVTKSGGVAKNYTLLDIKSILDESEDAIKSSKMDDLDDVTKVKNFKEVMGYVGYTSGKEEDRRKLYVLRMYDLKRKKDGKQFGYSVVTRSIGSGKEARFTLFNSLFDKQPFKEDDIIICTSYERDGQYFTLKGYRKWQAQ